MSLNAGLLCHHGNYRGLLFSPLAEVFNYFEYVLKFFKTTLQNSVACLTYVNTQTSLEAQFSDENVSFQPI